MKNYSIILLAAGQSSRMGQAKQLLPIDNEPLIVHTLRKTIALNPHSIITVLGANQEKIKAVLDPSKTHIVYNPHWQAGMGASVAVGVQALRKVHPNAQAILILVADQPFLSSRLLEDMIALYENSKHSIIAANYGKTFGVPVLFDKKWWGELQQLTGDRGAKKLIATHEEELGLVDFPEGLFDLDTPEDYRRFLNQKS